MLLSPSWSDYRHHGRFYNSFLYFKRFKLYPCIYFYLHYFPIILLSLYNCALASIAVSPSPFMVYIYIYIYIASCYSKVLVVAPYCSKFLKLLRFGTFDVEHVFCVLSYFSTFHIFDVNALRWKCYQPMKFGEKIYILHLWALEELMD